MNEQEKEKEKCSPVLCLLVNKDPRMRGESINLDLIAAAQDPVADHLSLVVDPINTNVVSRCVDEPDEGAVTIVYRPEHRRRLLIFFLLFHDVSHNLRSV
jgi:hypothetical protein